MYNVQMIAEISKFIALFIMLEFLT